MLPWFRATSGRRPAIPPIARRRHLIRVRPKNAEVAEMTVAELMLETRGLARLPRRSHDLDLRAAIHHDDRACRLRPRLRGPIDHAELHPDHSRRLGQRQRLVDDECAGMFGGAEDLDHVDRVRQIGEARHARDAVHLLTGDGGADADAMIASTHEKRGDIVGRASRIGGEAHDRDGADGLEERVKIGVCHRGILLPCQLKRRRSGIEPPSCP